MILFVLLVLALAFLLQKCLTGRDLKDIRGDHWPQVRLAEPDEPFDIRIRVDNRGRRFVPFLRVSTCLGKGVIPQKDTAAVTTDVWGNFCVSFSTWLRPRQRLERSISVSIGQRGRYVLNPLTLTGGDFLGLREESITCDRFSEVIIPPRAAALEHLEEMFGGFLGQVSVNRFILEDPVLTLGHREYTGREPMKAISWKQTARSGSLMVKKYDHTLEPTVSVVMNVDTLHPQREEQQEKCYALARAVCEKLEKRGVKYTFTSNAMLAGESAVNVAEGLGSRHFNGILDHLGRATGQITMPAAKLLEKEALRGSAAGRILITPSLEGMDPRPLNRLREAAGGCLMVLKAEEVGA